MLILTLSLQQEQKYNICLKYSKILKTKSWWFFRYCMRENRKINTNAVMRVSYCNKNDPEKKMKPKSLKLGVEIGF